METESANNVVLALETEDTSLSCRQEVLDLWRLKLRPETMRCMIVDCSDETNDIIVYILHTVTIKWLRSSGLQETTGLESDLARR